MKFPVFSQLAGNFRDEFARDCLLQWRVGEPSVPKRRRRRESRRIAGVWFSLVVGWTDPEGAQPWLGALLLAYYDPDDRLVYAGRAGAGIDHHGMGRLSTTTR